MNKHGYMVGQKFGRLSILYLTGNKDCNYSPKFECLCECGNLTEVSRAALVSGHTKSCGCYNKEKTRETQQTHGYTKTKVYRAWLMAKDRCSNPNNPAYRVYGGAGISMSEDFVDDPTAWCEYLGDPPDKRKWSVDRINPFGNYEAGNIRWALPVDQGRNTKKPYHNTSGNTGVCWYVNNNGYTYAKAFWTDLCGKSKCKTFSVKKYGLLPAYLKACQHREGIIGSLNSMGAGYGEFHGK